MSEFHCLKLGPHLKLTSGFPFASSGFSDEGIPLIRIRDVLASKTETYFRGLVPPGYLITQGDILVGMDGDFHVVRWRGPDALLNQRVLKVDVRDESSIVLAYLFHLLGPLVKKINEITAATTVKHLSTKDLTKAKVSIPSIPQQRRIAKIIDSIDTAIEKTEALIAKYQQIKAGLMHDLFTRGVLPNGQLRPPREQAPELYQETAIGWIPREWVVSTLRACLLGNPTNGIYKSADQIGAEGTLMVGQTAFTAERSVDFSLCRRGVVSPAEIRHYGLAEGDVLITRVFATIEGVGLPTLVPHIPEPAVYESNMMRLQVNLCSVVPRLLFEWLRSPAARAHISSRVNASNQCSVNQSVINSLPVPIPDPDEQNWINSRIEAADKRIDTEITILGKLKKQKVGLMHDLLTGKVPVKVEEAEMVDG